MEALLIIEYLKRTLEEIEQGGTEFPSALTHAVTFALLPLSANVIFRTCFIPFGTTGFTGVWIVQMPDSSTL